eukprot:7138153-Alexandrium_andersonii.AAC.1
MWAKEVQRRAARRARASERCHGALDRIWTRHRAKVLQLRDSMQEAEDRVETCMRAREIEPVGHLLRMA